jgi:hypothetical protein
MKHLEIKSFAETAKALANTQMAMSVAQHIKDVGLLSEKLKGNEFDISHFGKQLTVCIKANMWRYKYTIVLNGEDIRKIYYDVQVEKYHRTKVDFQKKKWYWKSGICRGSNSDFVSGLISDIAHDCGILKQKVDEMQQKDHPSKIVNVPKEVLVDV